MQLLASLAKLFDGKSDDERYLERATSLEDLERRQKVLMRNEAPHQHDRNPAWITGNYH